MPLFSLLKTPHVVTFGGPNVTFGGSYRDLLGAYRDLWGADFEVVHRLL